MTYAGPAYAQAPYAGGGGSAVQPVPGFRVAYDMDGSRVYAIDGDATQGALLSHSMVVALNDEVEASGIDPALRLGTSPSGLAIVFPVPMDVAAYFVAGSGLQPGALRYSSDTEDSLDGSWATAQAAWDSFPDSGDWRKVEALETPLTGVKGLRFFQQAPGATFTSLHIYATPTTRHRLAIWDPDLDQSLDPTTTDLGPVAAGEARTLRFRVKNTSDLVTFPDIALSFEELSPNDLAEHGLLTTDDLVYYSTLNIGDLQPGEVSQVITLRTTPGDQTPLTADPRAARLRVDVGGQDSVVVEVPTEMQLLDDGAWFFATGDPVPDPQDASTLALEDHLLVADDNGLHMVSRSDGSRVAQSAGLGGPSARDLVDLGGGIFGVVAIDGTSAMYVYLYEVDFVAETINHFGTSAYNGTCAHVEGVGLGAHDEVWVTFLDGTAFKLWRVPFTRSPLGVGFTSTHPFHTAGSQGANIALVAAPEQDGVLAYFRDRTSSSSDSYERYLALITRMDDATVSVTKTHAAQVGNTNSTNFGDPGRAEFTKLTRLSPSLYAASWMVGKESTEGGFWVSRHFTIDTSSGTPVLGPNTDLYQGFLDDDGTDYTAAHPFAASTGLDDGRFLLVVDHFTSDWSDEHAGGVVIAHVDGELTKEVSYTRMVEIGVDVSNPEASYWYTYLDGAVPDPSGRGEWVVFYGRSDLVEVRWYEWRVEEVQDF